MRISTWLLAAFLLGSVSYFFIYSQIAKISAPCTSTENTDVDFVQEQCPPCEVCATCEACAPCEVCAPCAGNRSVQEQCAPYCNAPPPIPPTAPVGWGCIKPMPVKKDVCSHPNSSDLKIFVVDFKGTSIEEMMEKLVEATRTAYLGGMYDTEHVVMNRMLASKHRTDNPDEADFFYIHVPSSFMLYEHYSATLDYSGVYDTVMHIYRVMFTELPYFRRQLGADHVITFSHDIGSAMAPLELQNCIFLQHNGDLNIKWQEAFAPSPNIWGNREFVKRLSAPFFSQWKDIVIPPYVGDPGFRHGAGAMRIINENERESNHSRPRLGFLRGATDADRRYSRGVRQFLVEAYKDDPDIDIITGHTDTQSTYIEEMKSSKFCFAPAGHAVWSPRMAQAIMSGCVPVIVADYAFHPWESTLDYDKFSVRLRRDEVLRRSPTAPTTQRSETSKTQDTHTHTPEYDLEYSATKLKDMLLEMVRNGEWRKKQMELIKVWNLFAYKDLRNDNNDDAVIGKDAFDMIIDELKHKKDQIDSRKTKPHCYDGEVLELNYNFVPVCGKKYDL